MGIIFFLMGMIGLPKYEPEGKDDSTKITSETTALSPGESATNVDLNTDSPLVAAVRKYSERFAPVKPVKEKPAGENKTNETVAAPLPPPPPPPPPPTIQPPPFRLEGTVLIGADSGVAWLMLPGKSEAEAFFVGEEVDKYKIKKVSDGEVLVEREGKDFTLKVPKPAPGEITMTMPESLSDMGRGKKEELMPPPRPPRPLRRLRP